MTDAIGQEVKNGDLLHIVVGKGDAAHSALVVVVNAETAETRKLRTNKDGEYEYVNRWGYSDPERRKRIGFKQAVVVDPKKVKDEQLKKFLKENVNGK